MKNKLLILFSAILISSFIYSGQSYAGDAKLKTVPGENYKLLELKNKFLNTDTKRNSVTVFKIENTQMSKTSGMLLGGKLV